MNNIKLDEIPINTIDIIPAFNIREDFGVEETKELKESLHSTSGNIQPIIVCKKDNNRYELISGERRLKALKALNFSNVLVIIYDKLDDLQKCQIMFNENMGRKLLSWQEEIKGLKRLQNLGNDVDFNFLKKNHNKRRIWILLEGLQAIEEFPQLLKLKTINQCITQYRKIKREKEGIRTKDRIINLRNNNTNVKDDAKTKKILAANKQSQDLVIDELKEEVNSYKSKIDNIFETVKEMNKIERLSRGIWLVDEVRQMIKSARSCENFGQLDENNIECQNCNKSSHAIYVKCEFYRDEISDG